jgi:hypothetical protein
MTAAVCRMRVPGSDIAAPVIDTDASVGDRGPLVSETEPPACETALEVTAMVV